MRHGFDDYEETMGGISFGKTLQKGLLECLKPRCYEKTREH